MAEPVRYSIVIPVYNEEKVISETYQRLKKVMDSIGDEYELVFVDDGSRDRSAVLIEELCTADRRVRLLSFSRNFGHQVAITAGMDYAAGEAVVVIDADLQDPPEVIPEMIRRWQQGYEVVYGRRSQRKGETVFKKLTAAIFYRFLRGLTDVEIPVDTGDFRLLDRKVCLEMKKLTEKNRYIRGLVSWLGFRQTSVEYVREERWAGETKYPLRKMVKFALDAVTSFSHKPLKLATYLGFVISAGGFIYLLAVLYQKFFTGNAAPGWASIVTINLFFNGIILIILGIIGEYIGRIYDESKDRPLYVLHRTVGYDARPPADEKDE